MADGHESGPLLLPFADLRDELDELLGDRDLSLAVERQLRGSVRSPHESRRRRWRRAIALGVAGLVAVLVVPPARAAVFDLFRMGAITVEAPDPTAPPRVASPSPSGTGLHPFVGLGAEGSVDGVRAQMPLVVPTSPGLGRPDQVRFERTTAPHASLLYRARPGLPEIANSDGAGLLIEEFHGDGSEMMRKYLSQRTTVDPIDIDGQPAVFFSGDRHVAWYVDAAGNERMETERTVGNALIFQRGPLTIRIEGDVGRDRMIEIARSLA